MWDGVKLLKTTCGYNPTVFIKMLRQHGGVQTVKLLLATETIQYGLLRLKQENLLIYSVENAVWQQKYLPLFSVSERATARKRLRDFGFEPTKWP